MSSHYLFNFTKKGAAKGRSLREQAAELLDAKLWGIGAKTPNRASLAPGDRVLIYVGAPESAFIGHAELASATHTWTAEEQARYPGDWDSGVAFSKAELWPHPIPMKSILSSLELKETNPNAHFFAGVARLKQNDYETVITAVGGPIPPPTPSPTSAPATPSPTPAPTADGSVNLDLLFKTVEKLKDAAALNFSEDDTRVAFIDKYLDALGYTDLGDVQRGLPVAAGTFADYVVRINDAPAIVIEAKKLGANLGEQAAGQVCAYCTNLGVRWGAVTDGRHFNLYDTPVLG